jgi:very-short-patch-repair endonuclease
MEKYREAAAEQPSSEDDRAALEAKVSAAVAVWTRQLIDLGGRNTLLYYRDLKQGTLALDDAAPLHRERLLGGHTVRLSNLFNAESLGGAARRARTVRAKAAENFEERGLQTLFLSWGMATWTNTRGTAVPAAPVLLRQAHLAPRGGAEEDFDLSLPGEWELNPTLLHLLSVDHDVDVEGAALLDLLDPDADPPDARPVFERLGKEATDVAGFGVAWRTVLGNFSYAKLPMVKDLETAGEMLAANTLVTAIAGDEASKEVLRSRYPSGLREDAPDHTPPADEFLVLDADASQSYVINATIAGANLVCLGPPGTGKSQTIANLIATLAARRKRVLFVAEKRAAIDAVLKRLTAVGLDDLVMDLHDGPGSRRVLAQQLSRALTSASQVPLPNMAADQKLLVRRRSELRDGKEALHKRRDPWGLSVFDIQAELLGLDSTVHSAQRFTGDFLLALSEDVYRTATADLESYVGLGGFDIWSSASPWVTALWAGSITNADQASAALNAATTLTAHTLPGVTDTLRGLLGEVGLAEPASVAEWANPLDLLHDVAATLAVFRPEVFSLDLAALATELTPAARGAIARISHQLSDAVYRRARKALRAVAVAELPRGAALHQAVAAAADQVERWARASATGSGPLLPADLGRAVAAYGQIGAELRSLGAFAGLDLTVLSLDDLGRRLQELLDDRATLFRLPELCRLHQVLERHGLDPLLEEMRGRQLSVDQALGCVRYVWLSSILETVSLADVHVGAFDGPAHSRAVEEYRATDARHIASTPIRIRRAVAEHITAARDAYPKESQLVAAEAAKKRRHLPVRQLFQAAPHVLGAVKPCWAMSPLVVAQLLPVERCFDVVIFDEASQVTPADAVGALMRADQTVVAGDPHQLPPTPFFVALTDGAGDGDGDGQIDGALTQDIESVLDVMSAVLPAPYGTRTLSWHYRSRDERLIAFSNAQPSLYDWSLTTYPGVAGGDVLAQHHVPFVPGRVGQEESATDEVAKVVSLVTALAHEHPEESLGIITMGIKHSERIAEALRRARQEDATLDEFMSEAAREPIFVKNLERVQGDERDAIILTIGYGKLPDGRMQYRFGPINQEGGERRLNVAVTRARSHMTVVSSFGSIDLDPNHLHAEGAKMLARYLAYAESGGTDLGPHVRERPPLNPFEIDVRDKLTTAGIPLVAQYGVSGYWIDFAAQHPTEPGRMVLAIEADGASYHSGATARDRDRLRQQHLENLGWTFHRIWSTEWFHHHEAEITRALEAYDKAVEQADNPRSRRAAASDGPGAALATVPLAVPSNPQAPQRVGPPPVNAYRESIADYSTRELVALIRWIESDTLLRTEDQLLVEAMEHLGFQRRGWKIVAAITDAIARVRHPERYVRARAPRSAGGSRRVQKRFDWSSSRRDWPSVEFDQQRNLWVCTTHRDPACNKCPGALGLLRARNQGRSV